MRGKAECGRERQLLNAIKGARIDLAGRFQHQFQGLAHLHGFRPEFRGFAHGQETFVPASRGFSIACAPGLVQAPPDGCFQAADVECQCIADPAQSRLLVPHSAFLDRPLQTLRITVSADGKHRAGQSQKLRQPRARHSCLDHEDAFEVYWWMMPGYAGASP